MIGSCCSFNDRVAEGVRFLFSIPYAEAFGKGRGGISNVGGGWRFWKFGLLWYVHKIESLLGIMRGRKLLRFSLFKDWRLETYSCTVVDAGAVR